MGLSQGVILEVSPGVKPQFSRGQTKFSPGVSLGVRQGVIPRITKILKLGVSLVVSLGVSEGAILGISPKLK